MDFWCPASMTGGHICRSPPVRPGGPRCVSRWTPQWSGITRISTNARIYTLFFDDRRPMHLVATDGGFLPAPIALDTLRLAPGERAEILVDVSEGGGA